MTILLEKYGCDVLDAEVCHPPQHDWTDHLTERVKILSLTRGRVRFYIDLEGDEILLDCLRREIAKMGSARLSYYNYNTRSALIFFDPMQVTSVDVAVSVLKAVKDFGRRHGMCVIGETHQHNESYSRQGAEHHHDHGEHCDHDHSHGHDHHDHHDHSHKHDHDHGGHCHGPDDDCGHDHSSLQTQADIQREIVKIVGTGAMLGFFVWRRMRGVAPLLALGPMNTVSALLTIAAGYPIFKGGLNSLKKGKKLNDDTLISIAVAATLVMRENITGLSVVWLINIGRLLEAMTLRSSREQIKGLLDLTPDEVWLVQGDLKQKDQVLKKVAVGDVHLNDEVKVFKAERVALDGVVSSGTAYVIESHLTGEPVPKKKVVGDRVYAGSIIDSGEITFRVASLAHETILAKIVYEVERLRDKKAPIEKYGQKFASSFVPISLAIGAGVYLFTGDARRAITALVIACPCAAGLATPTAVSASIGRAARRGILLKGGAHLEELSKIDTIVFDKTGTLTRGYPEIQEVILFDKEIDEKELLNWAAHAEQFSSHPLARSILKEATARGIDLEAVQNFELIEGRGVVVELGADKIAVGSQKFMKERGITFSKTVEKKIQESKDKIAATLVFVARGESLAGVFLFSDQLRTEAFDVLQSLRSSGIKDIYLLSGDLQGTVDKVTDTLQLTAGHGELLPEDKQKFIEELQSQGKRVAMIGDGVNDAQALAAANISIAMAASQCDLAIETADITLAREDLRLVVDSFMISKKTMTTIKTNFVSAVGVNLGGLVLGASGQLSPLMAAVVHNLSTLVVVGNSMRLGFDLNKTSPSTTFKTN